MSHALTEVASIAGTVVVPDDGDLEDGASVEVPFQALTNRTKYLIQETPGATNWSQVNLPICNGAPVGVPGGLGDAWHLLGGPGPYWLEHDKSAGNKWAIDVCLPPLVTITQVKLWCNGSLVGGGHGALPATMPLVRFIELSTTLTANYTQTQSDTSANVAAYDVNHNITLTVSRLADPALRYAIEIEGEQGANSINDSFGFTALTVAWTKA
jgi:hypothetical protein